MWDSKEDQDTCFFKAVAVAKQILENQIESANAVNRADEKVQQAYKNSRDGDRGAALLSAVEKRPVQDRRPVCGVPQPARRVERQCVTDHKTKKSKPALPPVVGGAAAGGHRAEERHPGHQLLPRQPLLITAKD